MDKKLRVFKLRNRSEEDLNKDLTSLRQELFSLRVAKQAGGTASKVGRIRTVRKAIAKYLTVVNQKVRARVAEQYKKTDKKPIDLRAKKTRAIRRRLSKSQLRQRTLRQFKKQDNFPLRNFALKP
ncbi:Ribosomal protein L29 [Pseudocohnilembus persalinus]|uniref:Ribosomal protein L29 n=1 Tax=Pseudocohnilembus persalinus TaxID=266149 RepID=A0A0V0QV06_PSEPJ|nr:Ribosomal protein L29 [Pseudocohnilembus persalinus]|eukprot:KRX06243.1 Ribosomal protein L29 [Pseudocohnilembus persalinus]